MKFRRVNDDAFVVFVINAFADSVDDFHIFGEHSVCVIHASGTVYVTFFLRKFRAESSVLIVFFGKSIGNAELINL